MVMTAILTLTLTACAQPDSGPRISRSSTASESPDSSPLAPATPEDGTLIWGKDNTPPDSGWQKPELGVSHADPVYGTQTQRLTSAEGTRFDRNSYSRRQAENADGSLFFTYHGSAQYHVYSTSDAALVSTLRIHPDSEPQWHPSDPDLIRHLNGPNASTGTLVLLETDVTTGTTTVIADLTEDLEEVLPEALYLTDRSEGSPSQDGIRYAWMAYDADERPVGLISYDLGTRQLLGTTNLPDSTDWVSASPTGEYVVASSESGTYVYEADLTNRRLLTEAIEHSDLALGADGRDRYVYIDFNSSSATAGWLTSVDLDTLERTKLFDAYDDANTSMHISGKGYEKPGWVIVSSYNCKVEGAWTCNKVLAVELDGGRILNLAHTYNCGEDYWSETQATVNRSFTRVYFNSDGGSCGIDAEVYRLEVPSFG